MKFAFEDGRLYVRTSKRMMSFGFRPFMTHVSFKQLDSTFESLFVSAREEAINQLGGPRFWELQQEAKQRAAEAARRAGEEDLGRYSKMLIQYVRTGSIDGWEGQVFSETKRSEADWDCNDAGIPTGLNEIKCTCHCHEVAEV